MKRTGESVLYTPTRVFEAEMLECYGGMCDGQSQYMSPDDNNECATATGAIVWQRNGAGHLTGHADFYQVAWRWSARTGETERCLVWVS